MDRDIRAIRKRVHDRMFAAQEAATAEREANGITGEHDVLQEEANWLATLLADIDATFSPDQPVDRNLTLVQ